MCYSKAEGGERCEYSAAHTFYYISESWEQVFEKAKNLPHHHGVPNPYAGMRFTQFLKIAQSEQKKYLKLLRSEQERKTNPFVVKLNKRSQYQPKHPVMVLKTDEELAADMELRKELLEKAKTGPRTQTRRTRVTKPVVADIESNQQKVAPVINAKQQALKDKYIDLRSPRRNEQERVALQFGSEPEIHSTVVHERRQKALFTTNVETMNAAALDDDLEVRFNLISNKNVTPSILDELRNPGPNPTAWDLDVAERAQQKLALAIVA